MYKRQVVDCGVCSSVSSVVVPWFSFSERLAMSRNTDISQGSVATRLACGGVFVYEFVANFLLNLAVEEF